ncbi:MAG TPA: PAS domain S-box protein [Anaerolineales bacterium]|nr:PAS domain S-box protein [Anaerolineales bacterium]HNC88883.1 PAS domain S-box protein [Anaerolineales bacterium]
MKDDNLIPARKIAGIFRDTSRLRRIFYFFIGITSLVLVGGILVVLSTNDVTAALIIGGNLFLMPISTYLVYREKFDVAAGVLAVMLILSNTLLATWGLGIHSINIIAFSTILVMGSLVTRKWMLFSLVILTVLCIGWLVFGELWGLYTPGVLVHSVAGDFFSASILVLTTAILTYKLTEFLFDGFSLLQQEIAERKSVEYDLRERDAIFEAVTFSAEQFLKSSDWRDSINLVLERLGRTIHASHAYLFEHHNGPDNEMVDSMRYEWTAPGYASDLNNLEFQNSPLNDEGFEDYHQILMNGQPFVGNTSTFQPAERDYFSSLGIKSILEVPLFVNGQWWGTIGFDDYEVERTWNFSELDALKIAGGILSAAIQRQKADSALQESERIYRQAIEAAGAVPYYQDYRQNRYTFIGNGIQRIVGYSPQDFSPDTWNKIVMEAIPLGEGRGQRIEDVVQQVRSGKIRAWQSDVRVTLPNGEERWVNDSAIEMFDDSEVSYASIGILQDVTERKLAEFNLKKHESLLEAVTFAAEQFLKTANWRETIDVVLERLGREFNSSHAYLFQKHAAPNDQVVSSMIHEWTAPGLETDLDTPEFQNMPKNPMGFDRLYKILDSGEPLVGSASFFTTEEKAYLHSMNVAALLEIRIIVNGTHWGTLGVDDIYHEREWTTMEVDVIKVAASVLGAAIERQLTDDALKHELAERRRAEFALRFSEEKFSKAFHTTPVLMTIENSEGRFIDANKSFMDTLGLKREHVIGQSASELGVFQSPQDVHKLRDTFQEKGAIKDLEIGFRRKNGETGVALLSSERFYVDAGMYTLTSALDITDRKRAEQERERLIADLRLKNAEAETIRETTTIVISTLDISETVQRILEQLKRVVSYDSASVWLYKGRVAQLMGGIGLPELTEQDKSYIVNETEPDYIFWTQELPYILIGDIQKDYPQFPDFLHGWLSVPLKLRGRLLGFIALDSLTANQFTEADAQMALTYANQVSIALENARLFSDVQNQLNERQKLVNELENKNSELERFTYTVSHDLKSPLVTISGYLGYLEKDALAGKMDRLKIDLQRIQEAVRKMQTLLNELLELSRIGRMVNASQIIPFDELIREAVDIAHGQIQESGATLQTHPNLPAVYGDKPRLVEVMQNLIDNASKYMGSQPNPQIEIGFRDRQENLLTFFVRDNGIGIEPIHHERIFGLFEKLDAKSEGTGVGLALVRRIVEVHGGKVWVESSPGQGATFYFTLPAADS